MPQQKSFSFGYLDRSQDFKQVDASNSTKCENIELKENVLTHTAFAVDTSDYLNETTLFSEDREYVIADATSTPFLDADGHSIWNDVNGVSITLANVETDKIYRLVTEDDLSITAEPIGIELPPDLSVAITKHTVAGSAAQIDSDTTRKVMAGMTEGSFVLRMMARHCQDYLRTQAYYVWPTSILEAYILSHVTSSAVPSAIRAIPVYEVLWTKSGSPSITTRMAIADKSRDDNMFSYGIPVSSEWQSTNATTINGVEGLPVTFADLKTAYDALGESAKTARRFYSSDSIYSASITDVVTADAEPWLMGTGYNTTKANTSLGADKDEYNTMFITPMVFVGDVNDLTQFDSGYAISSVTKVWVYLRYIYKVSVNAFLFTISVGGPAPYHTHFTVPAFSFYTFFDVNVTENGVISITGDSLPQTVAFDVQTFDINTNGVILKTTLFKTATLSDATLTGVKATAAMVVGLDTVAYNKEVNGDSAYNNKIDYAVTVERDTIYGEDFSIESISSDPQGFYLFGTEHISSSGVKITLPQMDLLSMKTATGYTISEALTSLSGNIVLADSSQSAFATDLIEIDTEIMKIDNDPDNWLFVGDPVNVSAGILTTALTATSGDSSFQMLFAELTPQHDDVLLIDSEKLLAVVTTAGTVTATRGHLGTTPAIHSIGASVFKITAATVGTVTIPILQRAVYSTTASSHLSASAVYSVRDDIVNVDGTYGVDTSILGFDRINIYRFDTPLGFFQKLTTLSIPVGAGQMPAIGSITENRVVLTYSDSLAQGTLVGNPMNVVGNYPPPEALSIISHYGKLFIVPKAEPNKLIYSVTGEPDYYPEGFDYTFDTEITGIAENAETLFIGTNGSGLFCLYGDIEDNFTLRNTFPNESVEYKSLYTIEGVAFFIVRNKGVYITTGGLPDKLSVGLGDTLNNELELVSGSKSHSYYLNKRYYVFMKQTYASAAWKEIYTYYMYDTLKKGFLTGFTDGTVAGNESGIYETPYLYFGSDFPKQMLRAHVEFVGSIKVEVFSNRSDTAITTRTYHSDTRTIGNFWVNGLLSHYFWIRLTLYTHSAATTIYDFGIDRINLIELDKLHLTS